MDNILFLLEQYTYFIILPISIIEGPIVAVITGFLASQHFLNIFIAVPVVLAGDIIGDVLHYWLGRFGNKNIIPKYGRYIGITEERLQYMEKRFDRAHIWKTIFFGKFTHAPNSLILVMAGITKVDFLMFLLVSTVSTIPKALIFILIGWYFGASYELIGNYIANFGYIMAALVGAGACIYWFYIKKNPRYE